MIIELSICLVALVATGVLLVFAVRWCRSRRWLRLAFALVGIVALHGIAAQLVGPAMRGYLYRTADPEVAFLEYPFKGVPYESMLARSHDTAPGAELFRTFEKDRWNYYRWHDYATHPRWRLPYLADDRHRAEPSDAGNSRHASSGAAKPWPGATFTRVVGYTFLNEHPREDEFTLLRDEKLNEAQLKQFKTAEMPLNAAQASRLVIAASSAPVFHRGAACYEPRHIFVFYDGANKPVGAIEVCFRCQWVREIPEQENWKPDWVALAKLSWELGLGLGSPKVPLDRYLDILNGTAQ